MATILGIVAALGLVSALGAVWDRLRKRGGRTLAGRDAERVRAQGMLDYYANVRDSGQQ